jgi:O-antigen/teichoic acid export membrane protein
LSISFYIIGGFASVPIFFYVIDIMLCYRNKKESKILKINCISATINVCLTYYLIDFHRITGAITAVLVSQLVILTFYKFNIIK